MVLFSTTLSESANSVVNDSAMISKVYFPRIIVPTASLLVNLIDFFISFAILVGMMVWYRYIPTLYILMMPLFMLQAAIGWGYLISELNVKYRDFRFIIPFIVQMGLYISPVGFSSQIVPGQWRMIYSINPMVGVIDGFRWMITGSESMLNNTPRFWLSTTVSVL